MSFCSRRLASYVVFPQVDEIRAFNDCFVSYRAATPRESQLCAAGDALVSCHRHYRSRPTHGIGRFKYLLPKEAPKRRKDRVQMKEISVGTEYEYGDVNIQMTSYDMCLVEHFAQYVHKLCNRLSIKVNERYEEHCSVFVISCR